MPRGKSNRKGSKGGSSQKGGQGKNQQGGYGQSQQPPRSRITPDMTRDDSWL